MITMHQIGPDGPDDLPPEVKSLLASLVESIAGNLEDLPCPGCGKPLKAHGLALGKAAHLAGPPPLPILPGPHQFIVTN